MRSRLVRSAIILTCLMAVAPISGVAQPGLGAVCVLPLIVKGGLSPAGESPVIAGCSVFPPDNVWNASVDALPIHPHSAAFVTNIGADAHMHADFGSGYCEVCRSIAIITPNEFTKIL